MILRLTGLFLEQRKLLKISNIIKKLPPAINYQKVSIKENQMNLPFLWEETVIK
jgi:hypothetical protein